VGDELERLGGAASQGAHCGTVVTAHVGEQGADRGLGRGNGNIDLPALDEIDVGAAVDQGNHLVHSLRRGAAEALELVAHGDAKSSKVVGRRIEEVALPKGATIGAIVRRREREEGEANAASQPYDYQVIIAHHDVIIEPEDHVIVFVVNKRLVPKIEKLFQVDFGFF